MDSVLVQNETLDDIVDAITERFILITSANRVTCNSMKRFVGMSGVGFVRIGSPNSIRHPF